VEFIDDHPVVAHRVRFANRIDITDNQSRLVKDDQVTVWLMRARCQPPQYHPIAPESDERYRFNVQRVVDAIPLEGEALTQAVAYLDHGGTQGTLNLNVPVHPDPPGLFDEIPADEVVTEPALAEPPSLGLAGEVERVGSIYANGHRPKSRDIIDQAFGGAP
jgi:hypothetical protein